MTCKRFAPRKLVGLLAKQELLNLSATRHREGVHEEDTARDLEAGDAIAQTVEHVFLGQHRAGFLDHERDGNLREPLVRHADDGDVVDARVFEQEAFDLCRVDVLATNLEEIFVAAEEAQASVDTQPLSFSFECLPLVGHQELPAELVDGDGLRPATYPIALIDRRDLYVL